MVETLPRFLLYALGPIIFRTDYECRYYPSGYFEVLFV